MQTRNICVASFVALLLTGCGAAQQQAIKPSPFPGQASSAVTEPAQPLVAIYDGSLLRLIDPATGSLRRQEGSNQTSVSAVSGPPGMIFVSITAADRSHTDVLAVPLSSATSAQIGAIPGRASAKTISPDGTHLYLSKYTDGDNTVTPVSILDLPIPARWQGTPQGNILRDVGGGLVSVDGQRSYLLSGTTLDVAEYHANSPPTTSRLSLPAPDGFTHALLLAPDGRSLYIVDFRHGESIYLVDVAKRAIIQSVQIRPQETTKQTVCAASLSPQGDRLYIAANNGSRENGIDVIDTTTMQRIGNFLPGRQFYCLAVSPDGHHLYAAAGSPIFADRKTPIVTTIDAGTGAEERTVPIALDATPFLTLVTNVN